MWACTRAARTWRLSLCFQVVVYANSERERLRGACVKLFQMRLYIRNKKMLQDFNSEVECLLCHLSQNLSLEMIIVKNKQYLLNNDDYYICHCTHLSNQLITQLADLLRCNPDAPGAAASFAPPAALCNSVFFFFFITDFPLYVTYKEQYG